MGTVSDEALENWTKNKNVAVVKMSDKVTESVFEIAVSEQQDDKKAEEEVEVEVEVEVEEEEEDSSAASSSVHSIPTSVVEDSTVGVDTTRTVRSFVGTDTSSDSDTDDDANASRDSQTKMTEKEVCSSAVSLVFLLYKIIFSLSPLMCVCVCSFWSYFPVLRKRKLMCGITPRMEGSKM